MTPARTLTTARLDLRGPQKRDLADFTAWITRSERMKAACAVGEWAGRTLGLEPLLSLMSPKDTRSLALAARLVTINERRDVVDSENCIMFRHLAHSDSRAVAQAAEVIA